MLEKIKTKPALSDSSPLHSEAIKQGKQFFIDAQKFNVIDAFKPLTVETIKSKLAETAFPFAVCMENWIGDLNFGSFIRNANAFNVKEIFYVGAKRFDRRGAQGTYHYKDVVFLPNIEDLKDLKRKYRFIGIDNIPGSVSLTNYSWFKNSRRDLPPLLIFGEEGCGLTTGMQYLCEEIVHIDMYGSVRSLNAATASGIIMHSVTSQIVI
jgi:tRNA G18 (ribose-2'-O)-methylase SpoU